MELNDAALTPEDKDQQSEIREKLRIVKTVLEQVDHRRHLGLDTQLRIPDHLLLHPPWS